MMTRFLIVLVLVIPSVARAQTPPSKTLERAIKLYDKEDWYSASIELKKVLDGETGDDAANLQRAAFFEAKAIYQLGFYAAALAGFTQILRDTTSVYRDPSVKWLIALTRVIPVGPEVGELFVEVGVSSATMDTLGDQRDEYAVLAGQALLARNDLDAARGILATIPAGSPMFAAARLALGEVAFRENHVADGVAAMADAARDPALAAIAVHDLAQWTRLLGDPSAAADVLDEVADGTGPGRDAAIYARSRLRVDVPALRGLTDSFDAIAFVAVCTAGEVELIQDGASRALAVFGRTAALRKRYDDAELYDAVRGAFADDDPDVAVIRLALGRAEPMRWAAALAREREVYAAADAAWRTTAIAADVQTKVELRSAVAEAEAGGWLRMRFEQLEAELRRFGDGVDATLPASSSGDGLVVPPSLCEAAGLPFTAPPPKPDERTPPPVTKKGGCAGCGASAFLLLLLGLRRGARRRLTPHRQLE